MTTQMDSSTWLALLVCALGTYAIRMLPLVWTRRHLARQHNKGVANQLPEWLGILGPLMIAAMFGVSLVPARADWVGGLATLAGTAATLLIWHRSRSLGKPVFAGVLVFGLVSWGLPLFW
ncbi:AzlD domain-containing protein [Alteromonas gilva]|uniref:AzlD domain-containing protein n=1 Tax=Alteromonas gilva TaxID=2987522 RepID=A0ABT5L4L9_9ALTE|nr:AzlD domain-containing protein [Alteromonas gilva]MDC8831336.1 AzlD domain-containing protein [Alteromonas gilva]